MTVYRQGDIVLVPFRYMDEDNEKKRPALVISTYKFNQENSGLIAAAISSSVPQQLDDNMLLISGQELMRTGLHKDSIIKTDAIFTVAKNRVIKSIGVSTNHLLVSTVEKVIRHIATR